MDDYDIQPLTTRRELDLDLAVLEAETDPNLPIDVFRDTRTISRTEKTDAAYEKRAIMLMKRVGRLYNKTPDIVDPRQVVIWLKFNTPELSHNSFRQYKSALMHYFTKVLKTPIALEAAEHLMGLSGQLALRKTTKTSGKKAKNMNKNRFDQLLIHLHKENFKYDHIIICWLQAGLLCGLRPIEWRTAELIEHEGELALKVLNAKSTNDRSNGTYRTLLLGDMSEDELNIVKQQLYNVKANSFDEESYNKFYLACSKRLSMVNAALFKSGKHITLYSARHQFSANAKAAKMSTQEVAALMGHAVDETAVEHYGKAMFGSTGGMKVKPVKEQVMTVKQSQNLIDSYIYRKSKHQEAKRQRKEREIAKQGNLFDNVINTPNTINDVSSTMNNGTSNQESTITHNQSGNTSNTMK